MLDKFHPHLMMYRNGFDKFKFVTVKHGNS